MPAFTIASPEAAPSTCRDPFDMTGVQPDAGASSSGSIGWMTGNWTPMASEGA